MRRRRPGARLAQLGKRMRRATKQRAKRMKRRLAWWVHNLVAHPLLVLCPPLGERLHKLTSAWMRLRGRR